MTTATTHLIDNSMLSDFRRCPRYFYYKHIDGLRPMGTDESPALTVGKAVHAAIEAHYEGLSPRKAFEEAWPLDLIIDGYDRAYIDDVLLGYCTAYPADEYEILANETSFEFPLIRLGRGDYAFCGTIDRIIVIDGYAYIMDTKTTSMNLSLMLQNQSMNAQYRGYAYYAFHNMLPENIKFGGAIVDAIYLDKRSKTPKFKAEHLKRQRIAINEYAMNEWHRETVATLELIDALEWPERHTDRCFDYFRACQFLDICSANGAHARNDMMNNYSSNNYWNPLTREEQHERVI